jgi:membrane-associated protease RseP (regulator of RpoE activity)
MTTNETNLHTSSWFERFMASGYGRLVRIGIGVTIIALSLLLLDGPARLVALLGLVPIAAGVFNLCPVAPLWGGHFIGAKYCGRG